MKKKTINVVGAAGNMGQRYMAILNCFPSVIPRPVDLDSWDLFSKKAAGTIIATPTDTHAEVIKKVADMAGDSHHMLCEKPIAKDPKVLAELLRRCENLDMVDQYYYALKEEVPGGMTSYNYYHSGPDGLEWDCINIIAKADGPLVLQNSSPIWECRINGYELDLQTVNEAYVDMVQDWLEFGMPNHEYIVSAHNAVRMVCGGA